MPTVSLCMIVKNGSNTLPVLLKSIKGHFDEYIFVDTGSQDNTVALLRDFHKTVDGFDVSVEIHSFAWIDDFAAARNESFKYAKSDWVMYLDADDELLNGEQIRKELAALQEHYPTVNCVTMPYQYLENDTDQDVLRLVKRSDPWVWEDEIHEHLECAAGRRRAVIGSVSVKHHKDMQEGLHAVERNAHIARKAYDASYSQAKRARMAAYLATNAMVRKNYDEAAVYFRETIAYYSGNAFALFAAYADYFRMELERKDLDSALTIASEMAGRHPEYAEGVLALCVVFTQRGEYFRAIMAYEEAQRKPEAQLKVLDNIWWTKGVCAVNAACSYLALGNVDTAMRTLANIPQGIQLHPAVRDQYLAVRTSALVKYGEETTSRYVDFLLWTCEPALAEHTLQNLPRVLEFSQSLHMKQAGIKERIKHLQSDEAYMAAYAAIPSETYHTSSHHRDLVLNLARVRELLKHVRISHPATALAIGFQDGIIEQAMLELDDNLVLTVADVAPQASQGFEELNSKFPGRVHRYVMEYPLDFPTGQWDLVTAFEVIEHVIDETEFVQQLNEKLKFGGTLMLSTPVSARWIENHLSNFEDVKHPYWHVRAFTHVELFRTLGYMDNPLVNVIEAEDSTFVVKAKKGLGSIASDAPLIQIYVPSTPQPFDAESLERGFVGGSEEAVIRLAKELEKQGNAVVIYAPMPQREDGCKLRVVNNVVWCDPIDFIPVEDAIVLYWRCPAALESALVQSVPHTKVLWLHDAYYGALPSTYALADHVLTLSLAHSNALNRHDHVPIDSMTRFQNGIDPSDFVGFDETHRKTNRVIYASSPERGLEFLLDHWAEVLEEVPDAELHVYYDWTAFKAGMPGDYTRLKNKLEDAGPSVIYHGGVSQPALNQAFREASIWAYPNEGEVETFCITALKAQACGCYPITTDAGALPEVISGAADLFTEEDLHDGAARYVSKIVAALKIPPTLETRLMIRRFALENFSWEAAADRLSIILGK